MMSQLLFNPTSEILKAKKEKNLNSTLIILLIESILIGLAAYILSTKTLAQPLLAILVVFLYLASKLFYGFLIQIVFTVLGGKGKYFEGLTSIVYAMFPIASSFFVSSILVLIHPVGVLLSIIILLIFSVMGVSTFYRGVKELFNVDMIVAWIGISILVLSTVVAMYLMVFSTVLQRPEFLPQLITSGRIEPGIFY